MRNIVYFIFGFLLLTSTVNAKEKKILLDELVDYNINVSTAENGLYQYMGSKDGLSVSFLATDKEVRKINYIFAAGNNDKFSDQITDVTQKLMPKKVTNTDKFSSQILSELSKLRKEGDDEKLNAAGNRFNFKLMNGMIHVQAVPYKYVNKI
ncbi:MAG: hypothetical protein ACK5N8_03660 [Alphaproteobacteria bacterium]